MVIHLYLRAWSTRMIIIRFRNQRAHVLFVANSANAIGRAEDRTDGHSPAKPTDEVGYRRLLECEPFSGVWVAQQCHASRASSTKNTRDLWSKLLHPRAHIQTPHSVRRRLSQIAGGWPPVYSRNIFILYGQMDMLLRSTTHIYHTFDPQRTTRNIRELCVAVAVVEVVANVARLCGCCSVDHRIYCVFVCIRARNNVFSIITSDEIMVCPICWSGECRPVIAYGWTGWTK